MSKISPNAIIRLAGPIALCPLAVLNRTDIQKEIVYRVGKHLTSQLWKDVEAYVRWALLRNHVQQPLRADQYTRESEVSGRVIRFLDKTLNPPPCLVHNGNSTALWVWHTTNAESRSRG